MTWEDVIKEGTKYGYEEYNNGEQTYIARDNTIIPPTSDPVFYKDGIITDSGGLDITEGRTYKQMIIILRALYEFED